MLGLELGGTVLQQLADLLVRGAPGFDLFLELLSGDLLFFALLLAQLLGRFLADLEELLVQIPVDLVDGV